MHVIQACVRYPPAPGGAENHVYNITRELASRGYQIDVITTDLYTEIPFVKLTSLKHKLRLESYDNDDNDDNDGNDDDAIPHITVHRFKAFTVGGEAHYVINPGAVTKFLKAEADLIHAHSYGYFHVNLAAFSTKLKAIPFVLTPHFHPSWSMWGGARRQLLRKFYDKFIAPYILRTTCRIICVSEHEKSQLLQFLSRRVAVQLASKIEVIPNGVDLARFNKLPSGELFRKHFDINTEHIVLYAGRLASNKGLDTLVKSAKLVLNVEPDTMFVLVGEDAGIGTKLKMLVSRLGLERNFLFTGHIENDELFLAGYRAADVFVLPSEYEAFGITLLEAMACETPCVATAVGGVPEALGVDGHAGYLVPYNSEQALSTALIKVLSDSKLRLRLGRNGRRRVYSKFCWKKIVDRLVEVYHEITCIPK